MVLTLIDLITNIAAVLLWFNWRLLRFDPLVRTSALSLAGTLKRPEPRRLKGWAFLLGLTMLLLLRAGFYWQVGSGANWVPRLNLVFVALVFRCDQYHLNHVLIYSLLSFSRALLVVYFWMMALVVINRGTTDPDPILKLLRLHLGRVARWSVPVQALLPFLTGVGLWLALQPWLVRSGVANRPGSWQHRLEQALLIGAGLYACLKYLIPLFLLLYLIVSYIYFGNSPLWDFVVATGRNLAAPFRRLPLQLGKYDLAPALALLLFVLLFYWPLPALAQYELARRGTILWPQ
jgi:uncharacterized protein YggT (Ycf19 family)